MKQNFTSTALIVVALILSVGFVNHTLAQQGLRSKSVATAPTLATAPNLGTAASFAVLGSSTVTNAGPSIVTGNLGVSPGASVTGFPPGIIIGTTYAGGPVAAQAQADALTAYNNLALETCDTNLTGQNLGGLTLTPGVYCFNTSAQLTGILTLDGQGNPNAVFVFKIGSTLTTAPGSSVLLINSVNAGNVFFQVGSSATVDVNTAFQGNIIAFASITLNTGASLTGRAIALAGGVTLGTNSVTTPSNLAPSAASVTVSGRVVNSQNQGIRNAVVTLTTAEGEVFRAITSPFGFFRFDLIPAGESYVAQVHSKRFTFNPQLITVNDQLTDLTFTAQE